MKAIHAPAPVWHAGRNGGDPLSEEHEELVVQVGERSGLTMAVAIHSTLLGPALGGLRVWHYANAEEGVSDALRLARAMTHKAAAAGLELGGGKGVICLPSPDAPEGAEREDALHDFGDLVESLGGRYITAEDVGTDARDMATIRERTHYVTGMPLELGGAGDPSPYTALGVESAIRATCRRVFGSRLLAGRSVAVVGVGHVGGRLARALAEYGVDLILADIDPDAKEIARELGARWLAPEQALVAECDVLAPCAVGGAITAENVERLRCRVVCGAANNQLADDGLADRLAARGVLYAPDFIANAGGLISVYRELKEYSADHAYELTLGIEETMGRILDTAEERSITPLAAAHELARARLDAAAA